MRRDTGAPRYESRVQAGHVLSERLSHLADRSPRVLAIPRGGVEVARPIAEALDATLDIILVRKLPIPFAPETAFGVIAEDGTTLLDEALIAELGLDDRTVEKVQVQVLGILQRYADEFGDVRPAIRVEGATVILVDDGLATGYTMLGAARVTRRRGAEKLVIAAPVSSDSAAALLEPEVDEFICPLVDPGFIGVSAYYADFPQLDDGDVRRILAGE